MIAVSNVRKLTDPAEPTDDIAGETPLRSFPFIGKTIRTRAQDIDSHIG